MPSNWDTVKHNGGEATMSSDTEDMELQDKEDKEQRTQPASPQSIPVRLALSHLPRAKPGLTQTRCGHKCGHVRNGPSACSLNPNTGEKFPEVNRAGVDLSVWAEHETATSDLREVHSSSV